MMSMHELFYGDEDSTWIIPGYTHDQEVPLVYHQLQEPYMYYYQDEPGAPRYKAQYQQRSHARVQSPTDEYQDVPYMYHQDEDAARYRAQYQRSHAQVQSPTRIYQDVPLYDETRYKAPVAETRYRPSFPVEQIVELMVPMCCTKCEEKVMETLLEMEGVEAVKTDQYNHRVTVRGFVDPIRVLKRVKKMKKRSEFMPRMLPYQHSFYESAKPYSHYPQSSQVHALQYYPEDSRAYAQELNYSHSLYAPAYYYHPY
ncbi:hypothetical protein BDL97_14G045500 [Sphagnum fallax]|jgi:copper chaperone CopZ|nr:hypothetical protein BDL97_14G045500 [Sphagnum fallax]